MTFRSWKWDTAKQVETPEQGFNEAMTFRSWKYIAFMEDFANVDTLQ